MNEIIKEIDQNMNLTELLHLKTRTNNYIWFRM